MGKDYRLGMHLSHCNTLKELTLPTTNKVSTLKRHCNVEDARVNITCGNSNNRRAKVENCFVGNLANACATFSTFSNLIISIAFFFLFLSLQCDAILSIRELELD